MYDKKNATLKSPDLNKLQPVVINMRTTIYIPVDADPVEAKERYLARLAERKP